MQFNRNRFWSGTKTLSFGEYVADIIVENTVIIEVKACKALDQIHRAQCMNYLKTTDSHLALLLNFESPKLEIKRLVHNF